MKSPLLLLALTAPILMAQLEPATDPAAAATALIRRVLPEHAERFLCEVTCLSP